MKKSCVPSYFLTPTKKAIDLETVAQGKNLTLSLTSNFLLGTCSSVTTNNLADVLTTFILDSDLRDDHQSSVQVKSKKNSLFSTYLYRLQPRELPL